MYLYEDLIHCAEARGLVAFDGTISEDVDMSKSVSCTEEEHHFDEISQNVSGNSLGHASKPHTYNATELVNLRKELYEMEVGYAGDLHNLYQITELMRKSNSEQVKLSRVALRRSCGVAHGILLDLTGLRTGVPQTRTICHSLEPLPLS